MAATFTWSISQLACVPQSELGPDFVVVAYWSCSATETANNTDYSGYNYGTCSFTVQQGADFTPYADLTESQVLGWCWANGVDKDANETSLQNGINSQINPPVVTPPLPWTP
jgi:hypothetical protein